MRAFASWAFLFVASVTQAQPGGTHPALPPEPPFINQIYLYLADSLTVCPKTDGQLSNRMRPFGGGQMSYSVNGTRSALRIKAADTLRFVVKMMTMAGDPSTILHLYRFESKRDSREAVIGNPGKFGGNKDPKNQVSFDVRLSGSDVFILIPSTRLTPGEYGFMNSMMMRQSGLSAAYTFFTFGVDPQ